MVAITVCMMLMYATDNKAFKIHYANVIYVIHIWQIAKTSFISCSCFLDCHLITQLHLWSFSSFLQSEGIYHFQLYVGKLIFSLW